MIQDLNSADNEITQEEAMLKADTYLDEIKSEQPRGGQTEGKNRSHINKYTTDDEKV